MGRRTSIGAIVALAAFVLLAPTASAERRDAVVESFDGTPIVTHFFPGKGLRKSQRAPTLLIGPGWSMSGETQGEGSSGVGGAFGVSPVSVFIEHGYNVLTWDPRGFGGSGGTVQIDDPRFEGRDVQALIDHVARQPEARLDGRGDPRLGMAGASYGGAIQLVAATIDRRIDAIAPTIAWHSLVSSLFPERSLKLGWGSILIAAGAEGATLPGFGSPAGPQAGHHDPHFYDTLVEGSSSGRVSDDNVEWFRSKGPAALVRKIKVPTLLIQGTVDTLFPLDEAVANFRRISHNKRTVRRRGKLLRQRVPTKMIWFCGGHGACFTGNGPEAYLDRRQLAWFDRHLRGRKVSTGPRFAWIADDGKLRHSARYPLRRTGTLRGTGNGTLPIVPGQGSGSLIFASPAPNSVKVAIPGPAEPANVIGAPRLDLTYSGSGAPEGTFVYAQVVDPRRNLVLGNMSTPIPVVLDGRQRSISRSLEIVAARAPAGGGYELQLTPSSSLWDQQRSAGAVTFSAIEVSLPVARPLRGRR